MYLTKRIYIGANYEHRNIKVEMNITKNGVTLPIDSSRITYIIEEVGYWRKANHIHQWFVTNCQNGRDDCKEYLVDEDKLNMLLRLCKQVKAFPKKAKQLLPTKNGFFFGSMEYDDCYLQNIDLTIEILEKLLAELNDSECEVYYRSEW